MEGRIEILPHPENPGGFLVCFPAEKSGKRVERICSGLMAELILRHYVPRQTSVERINNIFYFSVIVGRYLPVLGFWQI